MNSMSQESSRQPERQPERSPQEIPPPTGEDAPHAELGTAYLPEGDSASIGQRWNRIQAEFVDDPRESVTQAHALVGELMDAVAAGFTRERGELERQWSRGEQVSTEDLRVCLQRYRALFSRLLPQITRPERTK